MQPPIPIHQLRVRLSVREESREKSYKGLLVVRHS
jgi:hypothetical protein